MKLGKMLAACVLALGVAAGAAPGALAATVAPFTQQAFAAAQQQGKPILVHVTAPWCPVCAKQHVVLKELEQTPAFKDLLVYNVDFDSQKDVVRAMGARQQSTLIVFHGATEKGRAMGVTDPGAIKALLGTSAE